MCKPLPRFDVPYTSMAAFDDTEGLGSGLVIVIISSEVKADVLAAML